MHNFTLTNAVIAIIYLVFWFSVVPNTVTLKRNEV